MTKRIVAIALMSAGLAGCGDGSYPQASEAAALGAVLEVGPGRAFPNLVAVAPLVRAGDVVNVYGDATYGAVVFAAAGTAADKITIRGIRVNGKRPVVQGGANTIEVTGSHYVLEGLDVTRDSLRCIYHRANDVTIRDLVVHHCAAHGIHSSDGGAGSLTLDRVELHNSGAGTTKHQVYIETDQALYPGSVFRMMHSYVHDSRGGNAVKLRAQRNEISSTSGIPSGTIPT